jgi:hypothetical protein
MKTFPTDWTLFYRAGYHYLYEVKDCKRAAEIFIAAGKIGAPFWVSSLASKLYSRTGQLDIAASALQDAIRRFKGTPQEDFFRKQLDHLISENSGPGSERLPVACGPSPAH